MNDKEEKIIPLPDEDDDDYYNMDDYFTPENTDDDLPIIDW